MKKGVSLGINYVIAALLALSVILIVIFIFNKGYISNLGSLSRASLKSKCSDFCLLDQYKNITSIDGQCYTNPKSDFGKLEFKLSGKTKHCYDIVQCSAETPWGICYFGELSSYDEEEICDYAEQLGVVDRLEAIGVRCG